MFEAQVPLDYFYAKPYLAEQAIGWDRKTIALGLNELRTGIFCANDFKPRGNKKTEVKNPQMEIDIIALAEPQSQTDPKFQTLFKYTRITAKGMRVGGCPRIENLLRKSYFGHIFRLFSFNRTTICLK
ncbi:hypothetical protein [Methylobacter sp. S3L5C]|uniref:hypothetical protein n=1 Tax=Methylobacter sp. S3L5C TaxID=2839024 RepID=UPI001FAC6F57|nr:hypothetical protein [Methylobacter sp. S3L5C]UOA07028.1 hypothetical protein KKZ03_11895 [Methylobacter sp. S3L5C]